MENIPDFYRTVGTKATDTIKDKGKDKGKGKDKVDKQNLKSIKVLGVLAYKVVINRDNSIIRNCSIISSG